MTTQRNINTQALPCAARTGASAARSCVLAVRAWLMGSGMQRSMATISLYERGEQLRAHCQARLDAAQARIEAIVTGADGKPTGLRPFDDADAR